MKTLESRWASFDSVRNHIRTSILDAVDLLSENQGPIAPTRPVYFDVVVEAGRPGFDADSFRLGLQERLSRIPTCWRSAAGRVASMTMPGSSASVSNRLWRLLPRRPIGCASTSGPAAGSIATSSTPSSPSPGPPGFHHPKRWVAGPMGLH